jgi:hypothetical protein
MPSEAQKKLVQGFIKAKLDRKNIETKVAPLLDAGPALGDAIVEELLKAPMKSLQGANVHALLGLLYMWEHPKTADPVERLLTSKDFMVSRTASEFRGMIATADEVDEIVKLLSTQPDEGELYPVALVKGLVYPIKRGVFSEAQREVLFAAAAKLWPPEELPGDDTYPPALCDLCPAAAERMLLSPTYLSAECNTLYMVLDLITHLNITPPMSKVESIADSLIAIEENQDPDDGDYRFTQAALSSAIYVMAKHKHPAVKGLMTKLKKHKAKHLRELADSVYLPVGAQAGIHEFKELEPQITDLRLLKTGADKQTLISHLTPIYKLDY